MSLFFKSCVKTPTLVFSGGVSEGVVCLTVVQGDHPGGHGGVGEFGAVGLLLLLKQQGIAVRCVSNTFNNTPSAIYHHHVSDFL